MAYQKKIKTAERINRYRKAFPEESNGKSDVEIIYYLNFNKDLKKEVDLTLTKLKKAISKAEGRGRNDSV